MSTLFLFIAIIILPGSIALTSYNGRHNNISKLSSLLTTAAGGGGGVVVEIIFINLPHKQEG